MIAACDTFRAGAVEQLRTHVRHLNALHPPASGSGPASVLLYEKGYGKDAAAIAMDAINFGELLLTYPAKIAVCPLSLPIGKFCQEGLYWRNVLSYTKLYQSAPNCTKLHQWLFSQSMIKQTVNKLSVWGMALNIAKRWRRKNWKRKSEGASPRWPIFFPRP